jgi:hypothetical protein
MGQSAHQFTIRFITTKDVDLLVVRHDSMHSPCRRQVAVEERVRAAPGGELGALA